MVQWSALQVNNHQPLPPLTYCLWERGRGRPVAQVDSAVHTEMCWNFLPSGTSAAGVTVREEPMARQSSALCAWSKLASRVSVGRTLLIADLQESSFCLPSGRCSPKLISVSFSFPRHFGSSHSRPAHAHK